MAVSQIRKATDSMLEDEVDSQEIAQYLREQQEQQANMSDEGLIRVMGFSVEDIREIRQGEK